MRLSFIRFCSLDSNAAMKGLAAGHRIEIKLAVSFELISLVFGRLSQANPATLQPGGNNHGSLAWPFVRVYEILRVLASMNFTAR